jgi:hypothetical protein
MGRGTQGPVSTTVVPAGLAGETFRILIEEALNENREIEPLVSGRKRPQWVRRSSA